MYSDYLNKTIITNIFVCIILEEVFASNVALWFSPDGTKLAYIQFNDALIHLMHIPIYGPPGVIDFQYTQGISIPYPKVCGVYFNLVFQSTIYIC